MGSIGESGLYEYSHREINKLWYAVYYENEVLLYDTVENNTGSNSFQITVKLEELIDPTKLYFFFWATNKEDTRLIYINADNDYPAGLVELNYNNMNVTINPRWIDANYSDYLHYYDSFTGFFQFSDNKDEKGRSKTFILKRPFAEIHVLTDEFIETDLYKEYTKGITSICGLGNEQMCQENWNKLMYMPLVWNYGQKNLEYNNRFKYSNNANLSFCFFNDLKGNENRVRFKDREFDYIARFHILAPDITEEYYYNNDGSPLTFNLLNMMFWEYIDYGIGQRIHDRYVSIPLPEGGLKSNNKYIIYNKRFSEGGTGFLEGFYDYEMIVEPNNLWDEPDMETEADI